MNKPKQVQIDQSLFMTLYTIVEDLQAYELEYYTQQRVEAVIEPMRDKINAMIDRQHFTEYKTALDPVEREKKRKAWLERRGIAKDWQSSQEISLRNP